MTSRPPTTRRLAGAGVGIVLSALSALAAFSGCMTSDIVRPSGLPIPPGAVSDAPLSLTRRFPNEARPGTRFNGCLFASPLAIEDAGAHRVLVADGGGEVAALDPLTGAKVWSVVLPAPEGEQGFALSTPVIAGRRLVVSYHTVAVGSKRPTVSLPRLRHRLAVIDLDAHATRSRAASGSSSIRPRTATSGSSTPCRWDASMATRASRGPAAAVTTPACSTGPARS